MREPLSILLIVAGILLFGTGLVLYSGVQIPLPGNLPGDLSFEGENYAVYVPITTMILISLVLTLIMNLFFGG